MLTGKALFNTLLAELNEMGLPGMSSTLDEMYRSPNFLELDPLRAIANLGEPEYQNKMNKRIQCRLRSAHLRGCPQELTNCVDSAEREYLPRGITEALASLDFIDSGLNVCILGPSDSGKSYLAKAIGIVAFSFPGSSKSISLYEVIFRTCCACMTASLLPRPMMTLVLTVSLDCLKIA